MDLSKSRGYYVSTAQGAVGDPNCESISQRSLTGHGFMNGFMNGGLFDNSPSRHVRKSLFICCDEGLLRKWWSL